MMSGKAVGFVASAAAALACTMVASNLAVDLLYGWLDPRIRLGGAGSKVLAA